MDTILTDKIHNLTDEEIIFMININHNLGHLGPTQLQRMCVIINRTLLLLQKENIPCNIINITTMTNKILEPNQVTRAEVICILYYLQENMGNVIMKNDDMEMPTWSIQETGFNKMWTCS